MLICVNLLNLIYVDDEVIFVLYLFDILLIDVIELICVNNEIILMILCLCYGLFDNNLMIFKIFFFVFFLVGFWKKSVLIVLLINNILLN